MFDMAFVQDRSFRRARLIMLQTSTYNGTLAQRCFQSSLAPVMTCQAQINGNVSRTYMMPAPRTSPIDDAGYQPYNGMQFSSKGRWRDMTVYGRFQYWPGRFSF